MLDRFYLIVDSADWLVRLLPCGVKLVQLRVKDKDDATLRAEIARARDLCRAHGAQLVVNDYWRLAIDLGCDYVHLGQEDLAAAPRVLAPVRRGRGAVRAASRPRTRAVRPGGGARRRPRRFLRSGRRCAA